MVHFKNKFLLGFPRTLLIWKLSLPLFFLFCLLVQTSMTLEQWCLFWHSHQIRGFQNRMCYVLESQSILLPVTSPSKKLRLLSALAFVYFSLRKSSLWRSLSSVYFFLPSSRTLFILHSFSIQIHLKCPLKEGHSRNCCLVFLCSIFPLNSLDTSHEEAVKKYWLAGNIMH